MSIIRKGRKYAVNEILQYVMEKSGQPIRMDLDGSLVTINSDKLLTFKQKGICCAECHRQGQYFVKEKHITKRGGEYFHLNLYTIDENGKEILMTKDHIIPKTKGGLDDITNYQTMCEVCNTKKANKLNEELREKREKDMQMYQENQKGNYAFAEAFQKAHQKD